MTSQAYTEHEKYADQADEYLDQHNVYELFGTLLRELVLHQPEEPHAFLLNALEQPVKQLRVVLLSPPHPHIRLLLEQLIRSLGIVRLRLDNIVAEEVAAGSPLGTQAQSYVSSNQPLPDSLAIPLLSARASKADCMASGWILEGFPQSRTSALAMQAGGILPTHVLYFTNAPVPQGAEGEQLSEAERAAWEEFVRSGATVQEVFAPVAHFFDLAKSVPTLLSELETLLNAAPRSLAPKRPLKVLLLGPRGSGRRTQATRLAQKYGLVHINASALLRDEIQRTPELGERVRHFLDGGMLVPDEILSPLVVARVLSADAKERGFVLEGFPRTVGQADALAMASVRPSRVVLLSLRDEEALARLQARRVDPHTGDEYSLRDPEAEDALPGAVRDRLLHQLNDQASQAEQINFAIAGALPELQQRYATVAREFQAGGREAHSVEQVAAAKQALFEQIEDFLLAPINHNYAHVEAKRKQQSSQEAQ